MEERKGDNGLAARKAVASLSFCAVGDEGGRVTAVGICALARFSSANAATTVSFVSGGEGRGGIPITAAFGPKARSRGRRQICGKGGGRDECRCWRYRGGSGIDANETANDTSWRCHHSNCQAWAFLGCARR